MRKSAVNLLDSRTAKLLGGLLSGGWQGTKNVAKRHGYKLGPAAVGGITDMALNDPNIQDKLSDQVGGLGRSVANFGKWKNEHGLPGQLLFTGAGLAAGAGGTALGRLKPNLQPRLRTAGLSTLGAAGPMFGLTGLAHMNASGWMAHKNKYEGTLNATGQQLGRLRGENEALHQYIDELRKGDGGVSPEDMGKLMRTEPDGTKDFLNNMHGPTKDELDPSVAGKAKGLGNKALEQWNGLPNWGKALGIGGGALLGGHLVNRMTSGGKKDEEDEEEGGMMPGLGTVAGLGAAGLGLGALSEWDHNKLMNKDWWMGKGAGHKPLILVKESEYKQSDSLLSQGAGMIGKGALGGALDPSKVQQPPFNPQNVIDIATFGGPHFDQAESRPLPHQSLGDHMRYSALSGAMGAYGRSPDELGRPRGEPADQMLPHDPKVDRFNLAGPPATQLPTHQPPALAQAGNFGADLGQFGRKALDFGKGIVDTAKTLGKAAPEQPAQAPGSSFLSPIEHKGTYPAAVWNRSSDQIHQVPPAIAGGFMPPKDFSPETSGAEAAGQGIPKELNTPRQVTPPGAPTPPKDFSPETAHAGPLQDAANPNMARLADRVLTMHGGDKQKLMELAQQNLQKQVPPQVQKQGPQGIMGWIKHIWTNMSDMEKILLGAGLGLGAIGMMSMMGGGGDGKGSLLGPLLGIGGLGMAGYLAYDAAGRPGSTSDASGGLAPDSGTQLPDQPGAQPGNNPGTGGAIGGGAGPVSPVVPGTAKDMRSMPIDGIIREKAGPDTWRPAGVSKRIGPGALSGIPNGKDSTAGGSAGAAKGGPAMPGSAAPQPAAPPPLPDHIQAGAQQLQSLMPTLARDPRAFFEQLETLTQNYKPEDLPAIAAQLKPEQWQALSQGAQGLANTYGWASAKAKNLPNQVATMRVAADKWRAAQANAVPAQGGAGNGPFDLALLTPETIHGMPEQDYDRLLAQVRGQADGLKAMPADAAGPTAAAKKNLENQLATLGRTRTHGYFNNLKEPEGLDYLYHDHRPRYDQVISEAEALLKDPALATMYGVTTPEQVARLKALLDHNKGRMRPSER